MKSEIIRVEGPCSAGCIAFSPLWICTGPVAQRSEVMRWKSLVYRSHLRGEPVAAKRASAAVRQQGENTPPRTHRLPQNPMMDKWLGYPGRAIQ